MERLKSYFFTITLVSLLITGFYFLTFTAFLKKDRGEEFPILRERLGTILSTSSKDHSGQTNLDLKNDHIYCYYPNGATVYPGKSGEYIIRKVTNITSCQGWYGAVIFNEGHWVSEIEKIWWSKEQAAS